MAAETLTEEFDQAAHMLNKMPMTMSIAARVRLGMDILKKALGDMEGDRTRQEIVCLVGEELNDAIHDMDEAPGALNGQIVNLSGARHSRH